MFYAITGNNFGEKVEEQDLQLLYINTMVDSINMNNFIGAGHLERCHDRLQQLALQFHLYNGIFDNMCKEIAQIDFSSIRTNPELKEEITDIMTFTELQNKRISKDEY
jgi:hypothetical protein